MLHVRGRGGVLGVLAAVAWLLLAPGAALAADPPRTDPEVGTPAEAVYGIPLEEARRDAAPDIRPGTSIRTENAVGSSAHIPGLGRAPSADDREVDRERLSAQRARRQREATRAATRISGDPSPPATAVLLVLVVATAAAGGVGTGRLVGRRARL